MFLEYYKLKLRELFGDEGFFKIYLLSIYRKGHIPACYWSREAELSILISTVPVR